MKQTILIVEDEEDIRELLCHHMQQAGFDTVEAASGDDALEAVREKKPDLVVLDLMLPGIDGTEVCRTLKQDEETRDVPILMLTAKAEEIDRVVGFELGADDYVTKPFSPRELVLRVKAILKRARPERGGQEQIALHGLTLDVPKHEVAVDGRRIELTATEFKLLQTLVERRGRVQTREMLLESVWGYDYAGFTRTVDTHMRRLRAKLGDWGRHIETVRGVGYRVREDAS